MNIPGLTTAKYQILCGLFFFWPNCMRYTNFTKFILFVSSFLIMNWCNGCRRGISNFYNGKSKSFTSLTEASSSSNIKDIAKAENAYTRKRRNLLAFNQVWEKNRNFPLKSHGGGISKRPLSSSRSTLAFAVAMSSSSSESISNSSEDSISRSPPLPSSPLPPRHPQSKSTKNSILSSSPPQQNSSAWRSFSMVDLQQCVTSATTTTSTYQLWTKPVIPN